MHLRTMNKVALCTLLLLLVALPGAADMIESGADLWWTPGDGSSFYDFGLDPIPAGFFCRGSEVFESKVVFQGEPLATSPAGALGKVDTVIHRLDDAVFNGNGQAVTRVQPIALSMTGMQPIETRCGAYRVEVGLAGEQPTADMMIVREDEAGGYYHASLSLGVRFTFVPQSGRGSSLTLDRRVDFPVTGKTPWSSEGSTRGPNAGLVSVDTDGDGLADRFVPPSPGFTAGGLESSGDSKKIIPCQRIISCHAQEGHDHCVCNWY